MKDDQWYTWTANGGTRGAHDRTDGSGRWVEKYDEPEEVDFSAALAWLRKHEMLSVDESLDCMADAMQEMSKCDIIRDMGECLWREDKFVGLYRVDGVLYGVDVFECEVLEDEDEATVWVEDRTGEEAELQFNRQSNTRGRE